MNKSRVITVGSAAAVLALTAGAASATTTLVHSRDIKDGAVHGRDLSPGVNRGLAMAKLPATDGTVYRVAHYNGGAGGTAIGTVACADDDATSQQYVAIAGGMQILDADGDHDYTNDNAVAVADSFPGRMDWNTNGPKPARLDGWVIRWGNEAKSAAQVNVWAVCMKKSDNVQVQTTNY